MVNLIDPMFLKALLGLLLASLMAPIGALATLRGVSYLSAEVSHAALGGASLGFFLIYLGFSFSNPFLSALFFSIGVSLFTAYLGRRSGPEASGSAIGSMLALSMAIYALVRGLLPGEIKAMLDTYLIGDVLLLTSSDLVQIFIVVLVSLVTLALFYNEFVYVCFDYDGLETMGLNAKLYDYLLFALLGLSGVIEAKSIGAFLVFAFMIAPAGIAKEVTKSVGSFLFLSFLIAFLSSIIGLFISILFNLPTSGVVAIFPSSLYLIVVLKKMFSSEK
ncbi:metal ABC transporter permease [archaeon]|jgi:ABC-type Mn2+/Zn2+ transport system permease subunit|nr:metal ABC transporter permease [archaeon]NHV06476.1 metal ABC transporter permease [Nitrososphaerota archaeon]